MMFSKLKGRIIEKFGTQKRFAEVLGMHNNLVSQRMQKKIAFSKDDMLKWGKLLDIPPEQFYEYFF
ncbi:MAG: DUF739 family protein [Methanobrevibacter sp.]|nr:DUF739 family protein [Methanobrevibacter sp.]